MNIERQISVIWGKLDPFHSLLHHMIDAGAMAAALLDGAPFNVLMRRFCTAAGCTEDVARRWIPFLVAEHDIGKCAADFQGKADARTVQLLVDTGLKMRSEPLAFQHAAKSAEIVREYLSHRWSWGEKAVDVAVQAIQGHHGYFHGKGDEEEPVLIENWKPARDAILEQVVIAFQPARWSPSSFPLASIAGTILSGMLVLCDWVSSNEQLFSYAEITGNHPGIDTASYVALSAEHARSAVLRLGFDSLLAWSKDVSFASLWGADFTSLRPVQQIAQDMPVCLDPSLIIIEAPTGEGKTEAALLLATRYLAFAGYGGMYVALPTAATSNQMHGRIKAFISKHDKNRGESVMLVHGMAWLMDDRAQEQQDSPHDDADDDLATKDEEDRGQADSIEWFRPRKRSLLAPYAVGTVDQVMMSVMKVKFGFLRLLGLINKVLVIDEVHAYDAYMSQIIDRLLGWASRMDVPVIMLSATLPHIKKEDWIAAYQHPDRVPNGARIAPSIPGQAGKQHHEPYPLITVASKDGVKVWDSTHEYRQKRIKLTKWTGSLGNHAAVADLAISTYDRGKNVCVIANTVDAAQQIYAQILVKRADLRPRDDQDVPCMLYHARYKARDRQEIEKAVLAKYDKSSIPDKAGKVKNVRPARSILVATQVVEQSLDLDFDEMISEIAPVDLLIQRAGREYRHERASRPYRDDDPPMFHVLLPTLSSGSFGGSGMVYDPYVLMRTLDWLLVHDTITIPSMLRDIVETVYDFSGSIVDMPGYFSQDAVKAAKEKYFKEIIGDESSASQYLVLPPLDGMFSLPSSYGASFDEEEDSKQPLGSYFIARTRNGEITAKIVINEGDKYTDDLSLRTSPGIPAVREILMDSLPIPAWLVASARLPLAPWWLRGYNVLATVGGKHAFTGKDGTITTIAYDVLLGLYATREGDEKERIFEEVRTCKKK